VCPCRFSSPTAGCLTAGPRVGPWSASTGGSFCHSRWVRWEWNVFHALRVLSLFVAHARLGLADLNILWWSQSCSSSSRERVCWATVSIQCLRPARHALSTMQLGHTLVVHQMIATIRSAWEIGDREHSAGPAGRSTAALSGTDPDLHGLCFPRVHTTPALFTRAPRSWRAKRGRLRHHTDGERICSTAIGWNFGYVHMHNEATHHRHAAALPLRAGGGAGRLSTRSPSTRDPGLPAGWTLRPASSSTASCESRHGDPTALGRRRFRSRCCPSTSPAASKSPRTPGVSGGFLRLGSLCRPVCVLPKPCVCLTPYYKSNPSLRSPPPA